MRVVIAFDADKDLLAPDGKLLKPGVRRGEDKLIETLQPVSEVYSAEWNIAGGKGIDDLLVGGGSYNLIERYTKPTPRPRVPRPCAEPGDVDGSDELDDVRRRTAEIIISRYGPGYRDTVTMVAPPPGTAKTGAGLRGQEATGRLAAWGVGRHDQAAELVVRAREEHCGCSIARGECTTHRFVLNHDFGRNEDNCQNFEVVEAARVTGYGAQVGAWICGTQNEPLCASFFHCNYQSQFARSGSHVAPLEMLLGRPTITEQMGTVIFDDLDSSRLIQRTTVTARHVEQARSAPGSRLLRPLLPILAYAIEHASSLGHYHRAAYAALHDAACALGTTLEAILAQVPPVTALAPEPSVAGYRAAPAGQLIELVSMLHEEFPLYRGGGDFTSGLRITAEGIDVGRLSAPVVTEQGTTSLTGRSVVVLSSTPDPVLRQWQASLGLEVLAEYRPSVALPPNVRVIQDVAAFHGKASTQAHDPSALIGRALAALGELRPARPAAITHKHLRERVATELDIPLERVLYFGNLRGANSVRDADALLVLGTPGMRDDDAYWAACAAYRGPGAPPSRRMLMAARAYGGWRDESGRGREIDVLTFADRRVAEIYEGARRDELIQAIYRCRPFDVADDDQRRSLTVVLLTAMPIDGLRVDELRFSGNAARAEDLNHRLEVAMSDLEREALPTVSRALAKRAGTNVGSAQAFARRVSATRSPTCTDTLKQVGDQIAETLGEPPAPQCEDPARAAQVQDERKYVVGGRYLVRGVPLGPLQTPPGLAEWRDAAGYPYAGIITVEGETILIDDVRAALRTGRLRVLGVAPGEPSVAGGGS
jgi:hypothetical protein